MRHSAIHQLQSRPAVASGPWSEIQGFDFPAFLASGGDGALSRPARMAIAFYAGLLSWAALIGAGALAIS